MRVFNIFTGGTVQVQPEAQIRSLGRLVLALMVAGVAAQAVALVVNSMLWRLVLYEAPYRWMYRLTGVLAIGAYAAWIAAVLASIAVCILGGYHWSALTRRSRAIAFLCAVPPLLGIAVGVFIVLLLMSSVSILPR